MTSPQAPQSLLDYYSSVEQGSNRRFDQGLAAQAKQAKAQLDNQYRIARLQASTAAEQLAVDKWYKEQQVALAQKTFDENIRQFDKQYGLNEADTTGWFGGKPTLAREAQDAKLTGMYGGQQTLEAKELERRFGLAEGTLTGMYGGQQTLEAQELARRFGLDQSKFGLDVAKTAADLRSRPDMLFQYGEFARNLPGLLQAQGARSYGGGPQGQTIAGTLGEVGYGQPVRTGGSEPGMRYAQGQGGGESAYSPSAAGGMGPGGAPLTPQEEQRWQQLMARHDQLRAAGGQGLADADLAEARAYQARGATYAGPTAAGGPMPQYQAPTSAGGPGGYMHQGPDGSWQQGGGGMSPDMAYLSAAAPSASNDPVLAAIGKTYKAGFDKLGAQSLESMDPNDRGFLKSGGTFIGFDYDRELRKYAGSRLGQ